MVYRNSGELGGISLRTSVTCDTTLADPDFPSLPLIR